jgi:O-antigen/teichoic acid export membrane protein
VGFKTFVLLASLPLFLQHIIIGIAVARVTRTRFYLFCWNRFDNGAVSGVVRQGFGFLVPQAAAVFITNVPALFLSAVLGPAAVTPYKLCQQMGNALMMLQALPINPLWPAYAEAKSRGDWRWIRKMFRISLLYCTFSGLVVGAGIWLLGEWVVKIWTRGMVPELPPGLLPGFGLWLLLQAVIGAPNIFLNGIGKLRKQAIGAACCAVCFIIAAPFAIRQWGVPAPVFCLTFQTLLFSGTLMCWDTILIFRNHAIIRGR